LLALLISMPALAQEVTVQERDFFGAANQAYDAGNYRAAVPLYRAAIKGQQREPFAWFNLGNTLVQLDMPHLAVVAYIRSAELAPNFSRPWAMLGDLYFLHDAMGQAIACYRRVLEMGDGSEHIHYALGESYFRTGENTLSLKHFETVLRDNPDRIDVYFAMAEVYQRLGDLEQARTVLRDAIRLSPAAGADVYYHLAHLYMESDSAQAAISVMQDALSLDPENVNARRHLADLFVQTGAPWMAAFTLEEGLEREKEGKLALDLAQIYFSQERWADALTYYEQAWKYGEISGRTGMENVGHVYFNAGEEAKAEMIYKQIRMR